MGGICFRPREWFIDVSMSSVIGHMRMLTKVFRYGLPKYHLVEDTLIRLGYNNQTGPQAVLPSTYDTFDIGKSCVIL